MQQVGDDLAFDISRERHEQRRYSQVAQDTSNNLEDTARRLALRIEASFTALTTTLRTAAPPPGRRVVLAFGGTWPRDLALYLGVSEGRNGLARRLRDFYPQKAYSLVYETANLLGYTFYGADLYSVREAAGSAEVFGSSGRNGATNSRSDQQRQNDRDFERDATLMRYAEQTGGQAFTSGWGEQSLATLQEDIASFYWLGFTAKRSTRTRSTKSRCGSKARPQGAQPQAVQRPLAQKTRSTRSSTAGCFSPTPAPSRISPCCSAIRSKKAAS